MGNVETECPKCKEEKLIIEIGHVTGDGFFSTIKSCSNCGHKGTADDLKKLSRKLNALKIINQFKR